MDPTDIDSSNEVSLLGTPKDYSDDMYRFFFEVGEYQNAARNIIRNLLSPEKSGSMVSLPYGYELELPIQCVPDLVKQLEKENIAIYQIVRITKVNKKWT